MEPAIVEQVEQARRVSSVLQWLGWLVAALGVLGIISFSALWIAGSLSTEQGLSLVLGTMLASVLSGASAYGSGVNIALSAERLRFAAEDGPAA